jgi:hypothetical protein
MSEGDQFSMSPDMRQPGERNRMPMSLVGTEESLLQESCQPYGSRKPQYPPDSQGV